MEKAVFTVKTGLSREDYRKFLYIDTFKKSVLIWPMIVLCSAMGSVLVAALIDNWNILVIVACARSASITILKLSSKSAMAVAGR